MTIIHKNVYWLALAQACFLSATMAVITYGGLVGAKLAPLPSFATFPIFCAVATTAVTTGYFSRFMARTSRRTGFFLGSALGVCGALVAALAVYIANFWLFCGGLALIGLYAACALYYRFAALESVADHYGARAVSIVLLGSLLGAVLVPFLTGIVMDLFAPDVLVGAYVFVAASVLLGFAPLSQLRVVDRAVDQEEQSDAPARPLSQIVKQPVFIATVMNGVTGYALMSLVMTGSPLAMEMHGMGPEVSKYVIQMHVIAMFIPSLFTGFLIERFGVVKVLFAGHFFLMSAFFTGIMGVQFGHFSVGLIALGIGWNLCFVGGTTMLPRAYKTSEKAKTQGLNESLIYSAQAAATFLSGVLLYYYGWTKLNQIAMALLMVTILATIRYAWSKERQTDH